MTTFVRAHARTGRIAATRPKPLSLEQDPAKLKHLRCGLGR
jgi:hypothetical protein